MIAFGNDLLCYKIHGTFTRYRGPFVEYLLDDAAIGENNSCSRTELEAVHATILLCPFGESICVSMSISVATCQTGGMLLKVCFLLGKLMDVANHWQGWWAWDS